MTCRRTRAILGFTTWAAAAFSAGAAFAAVAAFTAGAAFAAPAVTVTSAELVVDASVARDAQGQPVLAFDIAAATEEFTLRSLRIRIEGSVDFARQIDAAALHADMDADRVVSASDVRLASRTHPFAAGKSLTFSGLAETIPADATRSFLLTLDLSGYPGEVQYIQAALHFAGDTDDPSGLLFSDGAESATSAFATVDGWDRVPGDAFEGGHYWTESPGGDYGNDVIADLVTPVLHLAAAPEESIAVTFAHRYFTEPGVDLCRVQVIDALGAVADLAVYSGVQVEWQSVSLPLMHLAGQDIRIRFRFESDRDITADGWHLDNVAVTGEKTNLIPAVQGPNLLLQRGLPRVRAASIPLAATGDLQRGDTDAVLMALEIEALDGDAILDRIHFTVGKDYYIKRELDRCRIYRDVNANGIVDAGDVLVASENSTDAEGQVFWFPALQSLGSTPNTSIEQPIAHRGRLYTRPTSNVPAYAYDPATNIWSPLDADPPYLPQISAGDYLYGLDLQRQRTYARLRPDSGLWTPIAQPFQHLGNLTIADWWGRPYIVRATDAVYYDPVVRTWITTPNTQSPHSGGAAIVTDGKIVLVGGLNSSGATEIYDPATNVWTTADGIEGFETVTALAADGPVVYAIGRRQLTVFPNESRISEVLDLATRQWTRIADFPVAPEQIRGAGVLAGVLHVFVYNALFVYEPHLDEWIVAHLHNLPRWRFIPEQGRVLGFGIHPGPYAGLDHAGAGFGELLPRGEIRRYLITADVSGSPEAVDLPLTPSVLGLVARSNDHAERILCDIDGDPGAGAPRLIAARPALLVSEENPLPDGQNYERGAPFAEVLAFTLRPENYPAQVQSITIRSTGTGDETLDIFKAQIWSDQDRTGNISDGDHPASGPFTFPVDDGAITFPFPTDWPATEVGNESSYLVVYDFGSVPGPSLTFEPRIESVAAWVPDYANESAYLTGDLGSSVIKLLFSDTVPTPTPTPAGTPTPTATPAPTVVPIANADVNNDGIVDYLDLMIIAEYWHQRVE